MEHWLHLNEWLMRSKVFFEWLPQCSSINQIGRTNVGTVHFSKPRIRWHFTFGMFKRYLSILCRDNIVLKVRCGLSAKTHLARVRKTSCFGLKYLIFLTPEHWCKTSLLKKNLFSARIRPHISLKKKYLVLGWKMSSHLVKYFPAANNTWSGLKRWQPSRLGFTPLLVPLHALITKKAHIHRTRT